MSKHQYTTLNERLDVLRKEDISFTEMSLYRKALAQKFFFDIINIKEMREYEDRKQEDYNR